MVTYVEKQLSLFDLCYRDMTAVVMDTEATMIAAGRMMAENAEQRGGVTKYKVRKNLEALQDSPASSPHVMSIATMMLVKLEEIFGSGVEGTVAAADLPEVP
jgi:hypothetical protein